MKSAWQLMHSSLRVSIVRVFTVAAVCCSLFHCAPREPAPQPGPALPQDGLWTIERSALPWAEGLPVAEPSPGLWVVSNDRGNDLALGFSRGPQAPAFLRANAMTLQMVMGTTIPAQTTNLIAVVPAAAGWESVTAIASIGASLGSDSLSLVVSPPGTPSEFGVVRFATASSGCDSNCGSDVRADGPQLSLFASSLSVDVVFHIRRSVVSGLETETVSQGASQDELEQNDAGMPSPVTCEQFWQSAAARVADIPGCTLVVEEAGIRDDRVRYQCWAFNDDSLPGLSDLLSRALDPLDAPTPDCHATFIGLGTSYSDSAPVTVAQMVELMALLQRAWNREHAGEPLAFVPLMELNESADGG